MDALSDLLRVVRFSGSVFLEANFRGKWCVRSQLSAKDCGPGIQLNDGLVAFHYVLDGRVQVQVSQESPRFAGPGRIIVLPRNDPHLLGNDLTMQPIDAHPLIRKAEAHELAHIDHGEGRKVSNRFVCGFLTTRMLEHPLLTALPPVIVADLRGQACAEWAETSFRYAAKEHAARRPGSQEILSRLSEMLFVEAVRGHIESLPVESKGWLAAMRDPMLSRVLGAMHSRPAHPWSADELAKEACLSRSAFAERFTNTLGVPPLSYLTRWRMLFAGQRLRDSADTIAQVAESIGYESESTFSRAFTRELGVAPGAWRKAGLR